MKPKTALQDGIRSWLATSDRWGEDCLGRHFLLAQEQRLLAHWTADPRWAQVEGHFYFEKEYEINGVLPFKFGLSTGAALVLRQIFERDQRDR